MPAIQEPSEMAEGQEEAAVEVEDVMVKQGQWSMCIFNLNTLRSVLLPTLPQ